MRTRSGCRAGEGERGEPPSDMPDDGVGVGRQRLRSTSATSAALPCGPAACRRRRPSEWPWPGRSTATSGRPSASATVSHVWAFWAPPWQEHELGGPVAPHQRAERAGRRRPRPASRRTAGGPSKGEPELGGVLVEQPELVVLALRSASQSRSMIVPVPSPPPQHIEIRP